MPTAREVRDEREEAHARARRTWPHTLARALEGAGARVGVGEQGLAIPAMCVCGERGCKLRDTRTYSQVPSTHTPAALVNHAPLSAKILAHLVVSR